MTEKDLLSFLQDIWEEDGMFNYLKINYTKYRENDLDTIKEIIITGLETEDFNIYKCISENILLSNNDFIKLELVESIEITKDQKSWEMEKNIYEVTFVSKDKWFNKLFVDKKIPNTFRKYIDV